MSLPTMSDRTTRLQGGRVSRALLGAIIASPAAPAWWVGAVDGDDASIWRDAHAMACQMDTRADVGPSTPRGRTVYAWRRGVRALANAYRARLRWRWRGALVADGIDALAAGLATRRGVNASDRASVRSPIVRPSDDRTARTIARGYVGEQATRQTIAREPSSPWDDAPCLPALARQTNADRRAAHARRCSDEARATTARREATREAKRRARAMRRVASVESVDLVGPVARHRDYAIALESRATVKREHGRAYATRAHAGIAARLLTRVDRAWQAGTLRGRSLASLILRGLDRALALSCPAQSLHYMVALQDASSHSGGTQARIQAVARLL